MTVQELTCKDQMKPAYIVLNEHIDQWRPSEWGNPTFIYQIRQTGYYSDSTGDIVPTANGKVITVALTVNDDGNGSSDITTNYFGIGKAQEKMSIRAISSITSTLPV